MTNYERTIAEMKSKLDSLDKTIRDRDSYVNVLETDNKNMNTTIHKIVQDSQLKDESFNHQIG